MAVNNLPPIPDGFELQSSSTSTGADNSGLPPIPDGFQLKDGSSGQSKPFYDAIGASMTPEEKVNHPVLAGIHQTAQDVATVGEKAINGLTLGGADWALRKGGIEPPNFDNTAPENKSGLNLIGDVSNMGAAGKTIGTIAKPVIKVVAPIVGNVINKTKSFANDLIAGPDRAREAAGLAKNILTDTTNEQLANTARLGKSKIDIAKSNADAASKGYDDLSDVMKKQVSKYSDKQGQDLQENLPKIFGQKSKEYGVAKDEIINSLPDERRIIPSDSVVKGMEQPLIKSGILRVEPSSGQVVMARSPMTPSEHQIFNLYESQKKFNSINVEDLIKTQKYIEPEYGKPWSPDDKLSADVARNFSKTITESVPELKQLNAKYAPFLEWKNTAIDSFKPFNGQYDVATGTLSKQGSQVVNPSEQRLLAQLQKVYESPYGARVNALNKGIQTTALNKEQAAQAASDGIKKLRDSLAKDLQQLRNAKTIASRNIDSQTNALIKKYNKQRVIAGLGLGTIGVAGTNKLVGFIKDFVRNN